MTLEEAVIVLNRECHNTFDTWELIGGVVMVAGDIADPVGYNKLYSPFEAIAIAREYKRRDHIKRIFAPLDEHLEEVA